MDNFDDHLTTPNVKRFYFWLVEISSFDKLLKLHYETYKIKFTFQKNFIL